MFLRAVIFTAAMLISATGYCYTLEQNVVRREFLIQRKGSIVVAISFNARQNAFFYSAAGRGTDVNRRYQRVTLSTFRQPITISYLWPDKPFGSVCTAEFPLNTDEVLTGILNEFGEAILPQIQDLFTAEVYSRNILYAQLKKAHDAKLKAAAEEADRKEQAEKAEKEKQESRKSSLTAIYESIKANTAPGSGETDLSNIVDLFSMMIIDNYGEQPVPANANEIQAKKIKDKNIQTHASVFENFMRYTRTRKTAFEFTFSSLKTMYEPKKQVYARVMEKARHDAKAIYARDNITYATIAPMSGGKITPEVWNKVIDEEAMKLIQKYHGDYGKDDEFTITYSMCDESVEIRNVPETFLENHSLGSRFSMTGYAKDIQEIDSDSRKKIKLIFDYNGLSVKEIGGK